jgi:hypothetical protein
VSRSPFRLIKPVNRRDASAGTLRRVRARAREIRTLEQLAAMLAQSKHPNQMAALLRPMLRPNLPCCAGTFVEKDGAKVIDHTEGCPSRAMDCVIEACR